MTMAMNGSYSKLKQNTKYSVILISSVITYYNQTSSSILLYFYFVLKLKLW